jgi:hypothetical protein
MRRYSYLFLSLLFAFTFTACDSDGDDDNGNGNGNGTVGDASVTVSGDLTDSFSGNAFFLVDENNGELDFALVLSSGAITSPNQGRFVALQREGDRPVPGTYTIDTDDGTEVTFNGGYLNFEESPGEISGALFVSADSGTLEITSSSADRVVGTFTFTGQVVDLSNPTDTSRTATVQGQFEAQLVEEGDVPVIPF